MKKSFFILTTLTLIFSVNTAMARNVSVDEAKNVALRYMNTAGSGNKAELSEINLIHQINNPELKIPACYFFNVSDWGWVIVSASTTMDPIIGYNDNGRNLDIERAPENMMSWVESFAGIVSAMQVEDANNPIEDNKTWTELLEGTNPSDNSTKASHILFWDEWDQGDNNGTTYNIFCPKHNGVSTVTGCVATALSQIVHYYQFPKVGQNSQRYYWQNDELDMSQPVNISLGFDTMHFDYSIMPNKIVSTTPTASRREVSRLCYAVGVAMKMNYGTIASGGSGAQSSLVPGTMFAYFKYNRCNQIVRASVGDATFMSKLRNELKLNRPVYMSGASQNHVGNDDRHAWVCCGYKDSTGTTTFKQYYMNWGWNGGGNGWFNLYDNTANSMRIDNYGYTFTNEQTAMIGLIPPHPDSSSVDFWDHLSITDVNNTELRAAYPNPATHSVTIPYSIKNADVLAVYNIKGELVEQVALQPGDSQVVINTDRMPAGIYIYRIGGATSKFVVR